MKIESKIKRENGSDIQVHGKLYKFRPDELDRHVCDVEDKRAIQRLLSIPEGFRILGDDDDSIENYTEQGRIKDSGTLDPGSVDDDIVLDDEDVENYTEDDSDTEDEDETGLSPEESNSAGDTDDSDDDEDLIDPDAVKAEWEHVFGQKAGRRNTDTMLKDLREAE